MRVEVRSSVQERVRASRLGARTQELYLGICDTTEAWNPDHQSQRGSRAHCNAMDGKTEV